MRGAYLCLRFTDGFVLVWLKVEKKRPNSQILRDEHQNLTFTRSRFESLGHFASGCKCWAVWIEQHETAAAAYVRWIFSFHFLQALLLFAQVHLLLVAPCPPSVACLFVDQTSSLFFSSLCSSVPLYHLHLHLFVSYRHFLNSFHCFFILSSSTPFHLLILSFFTSSFFPSFLYRVTSSIHHLTFLSFFISTLFIFLPSFFHLSSLLLPIIHFCPSFLFLFRPPPPQFPLLSLSPFPALPWKYWTWSLGEASALLLCQL